MQGRIVSELEIFFHDTAHMIGIADDVHLLYTFGEETGGIHVLDVLEHLPVLRFEKDLGGGREHLRVAELLADVTEVNCGDEANPLPAPRGGDLDRLDEIPDPRVSDGLMIGCDHLVEGGAEDRHYGYLPLAAQI